MQTTANIYLIKDLSRLSGHSIYTLKFYLKLGLIQETGRSPQTRFRYFDDSTTAQLSKIRAWRKQRKSLAEIQQLLSSMDETTHATLPTSPTLSQVSGHPSSDEPSVRAVGE